MLGSRPFAFSLTLQWRQEAGPGAVSGNEAFRAQLEARLKALGNGSARPGGSPDRLRLSRALWRAAGEALCAQRQGGKGGQTGRRAEGRSPGATRERRRQQCNMGSTPTKPLGHCLWDAKGSEFYGDGQSQVDFLQRRGPCSPVSVPTAQGQR